MHYTNAATIVTEDFRDTEDLDGLFSGCDAETRDLRPRVLAVRGHGGGGGAGKREIGDVPASQAPTAPTAATLERGRAPHRATTTLQHPRCVFQILRSATSPATRPSWSRRSAASRGSSSSRCAEALCENSGRERTQRHLLRRRLDAAHGRRAVHPHRLDHPAAAGQHRAPGRRDHGPARARVDPGLDRHPDALQHPARLPADARAPRRTSRSQDYVEQSTPPTGYWGNMGAYTVVAAEGVVGRRGHGRERLLLRPPAAHRRRPLRLRDAGRHGRRRASRASSSWARTRPSAPPTAAAAARRCANLDWLVVRDLVEIETASFWYDAPEIETGEVATGGHRHRGLLPARGRPRREGGHLHQHPAAAAVARAGRRAAAATAARSCGSCTTSGAACARSSRGSDRAARPRRARADLGLPDRGRPRRPRRRGGPARDQRRRPEDGHGDPRLPAAEGRRLDRVRLLDLRGLLRRRRQPGRPAQAGLASRLGGARVGLGLADEPPHPLQPRLRRPGRQAVVGAQALRLVGRRAGQVDGRGRARTSRPTWRPTTSRREDATRA